MREDVVVEMRDGTALAADVYSVPEETGGETPRPTLVTRTPYGKRSEAERARMIASHGYAVVVQDVRGKFGSEGTFTPYRSEGSSEAADGYDTVEWAATQPWSNGSVGTFGISYAGHTQLALARNETLPPHLDAMAPGFSAASYYGQGAYAGGAALLSHNFEYLNEFAIERYRRDHPGEPLPESLRSGQETIGQLFWRLPVTEAAPSERTGYSWAAEWHSHETYDEYWREQDYTRHHDTVDIPVLNYGGWYDIFAQGTVWNYRGLESNANAQPVELVVGPHTHGDTETEAQGQLNGHAHRFPNSSYSQDHLLVEWFDRHLDAAANRDAGVRAEREPRPPNVRLYVAQLDSWVGAAEYPLPETRTERYYLHSDGNANVDAVQSNGPGYRGRLDPSPPGQEPPDEYAYDPEDPVISVGGYNTHWDGGVADRGSAYRNRSDVLVYQTQPLNDPLAIVGPITVTLYASTSAVDTDFVVVLSDVDPLDREDATWVAEGARRGRIGDVESDPRDLQTYAEIEPVTPGEVYAWRIAVWPTARLFKPGHRLRIDITSSNFPRYNRNLNTGAGLTGEESAVAQQTIYHDTTRPSHVDLPVVPLTELEDRRIDGPIVDDGNGNRTPEPTKEQ